MGKGGCLWGGGQQPPGKGGGVRLQGKVISMVERGEGRGIEGDKYIDC